MHILLPLLRCINMINRFHFRCINTHIYLCQYSLFNGGEFIEYEFRILWVKKDESMMYSCSGPFSTSNHLPRLKIGTSENIGSQKLTIHIMNYYDDISAVTKGCLLEDSGATHLGTKNTPLWLLVCIYIYICHSSLPVATL